MRRVAWTSVYLKLGQLPGSEKSRDSAKNLAKSIGCELFGPGQRRCATWVGRDLSRVALERTRCDGKIGPTANQGNRTLAVAWTTHFVAEALGGRR